MQIDQATLTSKATAENAGKWLHETIRNNSTMAGLERREAAIVHTAWDLRKKAD